MNTVDPNMTEIMRQKGDCEGDGELSDEGKVVYMLTQLSKDIH